MLDVYTAGEMIRHTQGELACLRGARNWRTLFSGGRSMGRPSARLRPR